MVYVHLYQFHVAVVISNFQVKYTQLSAGASKVQVSFHFSQTE